MGLVSSIIIREAEERDQEAILSLMLEAYGEYEQAMPRDRWIEYAQSIKESVYRDGPTARIIAELNGEIVGSVQLFLSSETAYGRPELGIHSPIIRLLATSPKVRGKGVATELIKESARRTVLLGAETLHLHTSDVMASAVRLYEHLGFERAYDKEMLNGEILVKCYRLQLKETSLL